MTAFPQIWTPAREWWWGNKVTRCPVRFVFEFSCSQVYFAKWERINNPITISFLFLERFYPLREVIFTVREWSVQAFPILGGVVLCSLLRCLVAEQETGLTPTPERRKSSRVLCPVWEVCRSGVRVDYRDNFALEPGELRSVFHSSSHRVREEISFLSPGQFGHQLVNR